MPYDDVRRLELFDGLSDELLHAMVAASEEVTYAEGDVLWVEGEPAVFWWVLLEGRLEVDRHVGRERAVMATFDRPGQWGGGWAAFDPHGVYLVTGHAITDARILRVPVSALRTLVQGVPVVRHLIDGLFHTARDIEASTRQREALVALGTLAAGLAHELNNPAAAATRATDALEGSVDTLLASLHRLAQGDISAGQFRALDGLRREIEPAATALDPLELADREDEISTWLGQHQVPREWEIAPALAAAGVDLAWCERAADLLEPEALGPGLEWIASTLHAATLLAEVKDATGRISGLVASVKSYSQMDRASTQVTDVTEGLESTVVMLGHKLRQGDGIVVERDYAAQLPLIEAIPGELNQLWTNLIDNAIDAMDGAGTLRLRTRFDDDVVVVDVCDTGPGMPAVVQARAFEPFFTTKGVGHGTGLGLDISRRIVVEHHHGEITIASQPGSTVVTVHLPRRPGAP